VDQFTVINSAVRRENLGANLPARCLKNLLCGTHEYIIIISHGDTTSRADDDNNRMDVEMPTTKIGGSVFTLFHSWKPQAARSRKRKPLFDSSN
jgi:hypothetical protein